MRDVTSHPVHFHCFGWLAWLPALVCRKVQVGSVWVFYGCGCCLTHLVWQKHRFCEINSGRDETCQVATCLGPHRAESGRRLLWPYCHLFQFPWWCFGRAQIWNLHSTISNLKVSQRKRLPGAPAWSLFKGESGKNSNQLTTLAGSWPEGQR